MRLYLIFLIVLLNSYILNANETITITKSNSNFKEFNMQMYKDDSAKLSLDDIRAKRDFKTISNRISEGYSESHLWFKFKLKNSTDSRLKYMIYFTENMVHHLDCYIVSSDNTIKHYQTGAGYFIDGSPNILDHPKFEIEFEKDELKTIYIKMCSVYPNVGAFYLFDEDGFNDYTCLYNNIYSAYFGAILAIILYNIFLFLFSRNISYLYYVMLLTGFVLWQLTLNSFPPFKTFYSVGDYYLAGTPVNFMIIFIILFTRDVLSIKKEFPKLDKIMLAMLSIVVIITIASFLCRCSTTIYLNMIAPFIFPFLLYVAFKSYFSGNKIAIFFILAEIMFLIYSTVFSLMMQGHIPYNLFTRHSIAVGAGVELMLYSLILGYRIRLLQDDKIKLINRANKELKKSKDVLKEMSIRDALTNLYNRRELMIVSKQFIEDNTSFSLIMFDIDKFKNINDNYGHTVGDDIIVLFTNIIRENIRDDDLAFRFGGEEFVIILPNTTKAKAYNIASRIREVTNKKRIPIDDKDIVSFTISGGVSILSKDDKSLEEVIKRADEALYRAKNSGRNRIVA